MEEGARSGADLAGAKKVLEGVGEMRRVGAAAAEKAGVVAGGTAGGDVHRRTAPALGGGGVVVHENLGEDDV